MQLTDRQIELALGKKKPPRPVEAAEPFEYDPTLDRTLESLLKGEGRPKHYDCDNPWPPSNDPASVWYRRVRPVCLFGPVESDAVEIPNLLSCLRRSRLDRVREEALRALLYVLDEFTDKIAPETVAEGVAEIEANPQLHNEYTCKFLLSIKGQICQ